MLLLLLLCSARSYLSSFGLFGVDTEDLRKIINGCGYLLGRGISWACCTHFRYVSQDRVGWTAFFFAIDFFAVRNKPVLDLGVMYTTRSEA